jgi:hypothetical protein
MAGPSAAKEAAPSCWIPQRAALVRAPVLERAQPCTAPGERDRSAVYGNAADPALGRDVYRIDLLASDLTSGLPCAEG